jgi:NADH-quinone oxidoreductase subunit N
MNAPVIWIVFPILVSVALYFLRNFRIFGLIGAVVVSFLLALLAGIVPIGEAFQIGNFNLEVSSTLAVFGRRFVLTQNESTFLILMYCLAGVWFLGAGITWAHRFFAPFGMGMVAVLVAALAVEPFLYAALLVEVAVLFSIPILAPPGTPLKSGVQRFLLFQTLAMPFILLAGWLLGLGETNPNNPELLIRAGFLLGLGFAFWLAVFPFYSWVPQLAYETHPYPAGFVLSLLPISVLFLGLDFVNGFNWLRSSAELYQVLQIVGVLMVVTGGIWASFQNDISRLLGYAVIVETGFSLLAVGLRSAPGFSLFAIAFLPRLLGMIVLTLGLGVLINQGVNTDREGITGLLRRLPIASIAILAAVFSIGGFPLLGGFPVRLEILEQLATVSLLFTTWVMLGSIGFLIAGIRILVALVKWSSKETTIEETWPQRILLSLGILFLFLFGLLPGVFYEGIVDLLRVAPDMILTF